MPLKRNKQFISGSQAIAQTIKELQVDVISAYPITPQTHILEELAQFKEDHQADYEYIRAESEFAAASIILGASAAGGRTYSATSSQGVLLMMEVLFNASGLRLPLVMTVANRALSAPINIFNDHSDAMAMRDSGWLMFFAENHQEAIDLHIIAYKIAESLELPVAINVDGFIITHAYQEAFIPNRKIIESYLPKYKPIPNSYLDSNRPVSLGGYYDSVHYQKTRQELSKDIQKSQKKVNQEFKAWQKIWPTKKALKSTYDDGLIEYCGPKKPKAILIALGSLCGTIKEAIKSETNVGIIKIRSFRPFPKDSLNKIIPINCQLYILEKTIAIGSFGPLYQEVISSLNHFKGKATNYILGLGGQDINEADILNIIKANRS